MQLQGKTSKWHTLLFNEDAMKRYSYDLLANYDPLGFLTLHIFDKALLTMRRAGNLYNLDMSDVKQTKHGGSDVYNVKNSINTPNFT